MRGLAGLLIVLAAGSGLACYSPSAASGAPCSASGECPTGQFCNQSVTPPTCEAGDAGPPPPDAASCATGASCPAATPVCDMSTMTCRACVADDECGGGACVEHLGECIAASNLLFVAEDGTDTGDCSAAAPCATIGYALGRVANNRRTIAVGTGTYAGRVDIEAFGANSLTISGPDRDATRVTLAGGLTLDGATEEVLVENVTVSNSQGRAIDSQGTLTLARVRVTGAMTGIVATAGGTLRVVDSTIVDNAAAGIDVAQTRLDVLRTVVAANKGGGIAINNATTTIESSLVADNGGLLSAFGGVRYQNLNGKPQAFRFNTVAGNLSNLSASGVACSGSIALESSIFVAGTGTTPIVSQACEPTYSLFAADAPAGTGNLSGDPMFVAAGDYHLTASSPARDAADPAATTTRDIDGEPRPQGAGRDIGADEIP